MMLQWQNGVHFWKHNRFNIFIFCVDTNLYSLKSHNSIVRAFFMSTVRIILSGHDDIVLHLNSSDDKNTVNLFCAVERRDVILIVLAPKHFNAEMFGVYAWEIMYTSTDYVSQPIADSSA